MIDQNKIDFTKLNGLIPAVVIDNSSQQVLMVGFMNNEALDKTIETKLVTFFSRTRNSLWVKGETSGNFLELVDIVSDCDNDSILVYANPKGNTCHTGSYSCFGYEKDELFFLNDLFELIKKRKTELPEGSYTTSLFKSGADRIIQKVGEEAIETVIAAKNRNRTDVINEVSDFIYHLLVMLAEQNIELEEIAANLSKRHKK